MIRPTRSDSRKSARLLCLVLTLAVLGLVPAQAGASPETLRRAFGNIIGGPLDMILSPIVGGLTLARNIEEIEDSPAVRVVYAFPGWIWLTGLNFGAGGIRTITGTLETLPGVVLFPFETDIEPLFDPVEDAGALFEWETPLEYEENPWVYWNPLVAPFAIHPKFGINYTRAEF